jgi:hypothetical protein
VAQALDNRAANCSINDIRLLSIGTGYSPKYVAGDDCDWGLINWGPYIVSLMLDGGVGLVEYQAKQLLGDKHFCRVNPTLPIEIPMDDVTKIDMMRTLAREMDLTECKKWVKANFMGRAKKAVKPITP